MATGIEEPSSSMYFGLIADEETTTGFLLASFGATNPDTGVTNYYIVKADTPYKKLREYFLKLYSRKNIAILLLSTDVARRLEGVLEKANKVLPIILEIPSKESMVPSEVATKRHSLADIVRT